MPNNAQVIAIVGLAGRFPGAADLEALAAAANGASEAGSGLGRQLLVACAWEAIDRSGSAVREAARAGLFVGIEADPHAPSATVEEDVAQAARELGLGGPAVAVAAPSAPSLAAMERACQSLRRGECDTALAGAVSGAVAGVAVLKRLASALAEGDRVVGVVRGSAILPPSPPPGQVRDGVGEPQPTGERPVLATEYVPPSNRLEAAIAAIWQEQLGIDRVGVQDNFFELGGNSLLGTQILALLKDWLQQEIPTVSLYEGPTVSALARVILQGGGSGARRGYDAVRERGERRRRKLQRLAQEATAGLAE